MRKFLYTTVAAIGALASFVPVAQAADIIEEPIYIEPAPVPVAPLSTAGWYIRGDVGYVFSSSSHGRYKYVSGDKFHHGNYFTEEYGYDDIELGDGVMVGGGLGYRFNDFARVEITGDYFGADFRGTTSCPGYKSSDCHFDDKADADIWLLMANAYADLGTYGRFTPYVGGGLGFANVSYGELSNKFKCGDANKAELVGTHGVPCGETYKHDGESDWRFAYSLMAGTSIDITTQLKFDAGYKYTHVRGGAAFGYDKFDKGLGYSGVQSHDEGFDIHAVRAGLRYEFGGTGFGKGKGKGVSPVYSEPAPFYSEPSFEQDIVYK